MTDITDKEAQNAIEGQEGTAVEKVVSISGEVVNPEEKTIEMEKKKAVQILLAQLMSMDLTDVTVISNDADGKMGFFETMNNPALAVTFCEIGKNVAMSTIMMGGAPSE